MTAIGLMVTAAVVSATPEVRLADERSVAERSVRGVNLLANSLTSVNLLSTAFGVHTVLDRADSRTYGELHQGMHSRLAPTQPPLMITTILSAVPLLWWERDRPTGAPFLLNAAGLVGNIAVVVITLVFNGPLNTKIEHWDPAAMPDDWMQTRDAWNHAHNVRTGVAMGALVAHLAAAMVE